MASGTTYAIGLDYVYNPWTTSGGRLQQIKAGIAGSPTSLMNLSYTYDAVGNVLTIVDANAGGTQTQTFKYDSMNRLITAAAGGTGGTYTTQTYGFDAIGNITSTTLLGTYNYTTTVSPCGGITLSKPHALGKAGSNLYAYDCNGNVTKRTIGATSYTLTYDPENRLTGVTGTASFVYDGNRVQVTEGGVTTAYVGNYYEWAPTTAAKYYYAGSERISVSVPGTRYFLLGDHLGSTSKTATFTGTLVSEIRYGPWGDTRWSTGTTPTNFHFTGQRDESGIGLYYYGARWYDAGVRRWMQPDSIVPGAGDPQALNRYSYAGNNPTGYTDPSGNCVDDDHNTTNGDAYNCTPEELQALQWATRKWWIGSLADAGSASGWFANIQGILDFFSQNPLLSDLNGWASKSDAKLLWSIQEGFRQSSFGETAQSDAGQKWATFFSAAAGGSPDDAEMRNLWGNAEIAGTKAGEAYAGPLPGGLEGDVLRDFIAIGDGYRAVVDPVTAGKVGYEVGLQLIAPAFPSYHHRNDASIAEVTSALAVVLTDPRHSGPVWAGAWYATSVAAVYHAIGIFQH